MDHLLGAIYETRTHDSTLAMSRFTTKLILQIGAVDGTRTRNNQIGNLGLYQLNYYRIYGVPGGIRTHDPVIKSHMLVPAELQAHINALSGIEKSEPHFYCEIPMAPILYSWFYITLYFRAYRQERRTAQF